MIARRARLTVTGGGCGAGPRSHFLAVVAGRKWYRRDVLPRAEIAPPSLLVRCARWLAIRTAPPRSLVTSTGFGAASNWSLSGAWAAGFTIGMYLLFVNHDLFSLGFAEVVGWLLCATFGMLFWFWPFLASFYMYSPLRRYRWLARRSGAALYGALWHGTAHHLLIEGVGGAQWGASMLVPLVIGGLWGSWLPSAFATPGSFPDGIVSTDP